MAAPQNNVKAEPAVTLALHGLPLAELAPHCDVHSKSLKIKYKSFSHGTQGRYWLSVAVHLALIAAAVALKYVVSNLDTPMAPEVPIEVSFGQELPSRSAPEKAPPQEATKEAEQLPQIANNIVVDTDLAQNDDLVITKPDAQKKPLKPIEIEKSKAVEKQDAPAKKPIAEKTPPPGKTKISAEEMAKKIQRENRKIGEKDSKHTSHQVMSDIPPSPMDSGADLPDAPVGIGPGELDGKAPSSVLSGYSSAAKAHMRRYWRQSDASTFDKELEVIVSFQINLFGNLVGEVRVIKTSGSDPFDAEAVSQVKQAAPFPELPKELGKTQKIQMRMLPREIKS